MTTVDEAIFDSLYARRAALGNPSIEEVREALIITQNQYVLSPSILICLFTVCMFSAVDRPLGY